jgi:phosphatidylglycerophosphate synthase
MTLDAIDGKQARRTDNCSPLGQILDHNLDQLTQTCFMVAVLTMLQTGPNIWLILAMTPGVMSQHYAIEYRTHFTNFHQLVVGGIGSTEQLCIVMGVTLAAFFIPGGNGAFLAELPVLGVTARDIVVGGSLLTGLHYNLENIVYGYLAAKDKAYAAKCLVPYAQFVAMLWCSQWSRFWAANALRFIVVCGLFLLYANAIFNLNTMAGMRFTWLFFEPLLFVVLAAVDGAAWVSDRQAALLYAAFTMWLLVKYLLFMWAVVDQITTFMGLRFLKVKPVHKTKQN